MSFLQWAKAKEQVDKCVFDKYNLDKAAHDAFLFQTINFKLRKKVLMEDMILEDMVKMGLAHEPN